MEADMSETDEIVISMGVAALGRSTDTTEQILEGLYDQYAQALFRYAVSLVSSPEDAEDAVQEVFIRIAREYKHVMRIRNLKAYLFTATRNSAYSRLRERRRRNELSEAVICDLQTSPVETGTDFAESMVVSKAFSELPIEQREVLALKVYEQMTFDEIAKTTGASINTVASRYRYGIAKLRQALGVDDNG